MFFFKTKNNTKRYSNLASFNKLINNRIFNKELIKAELIIWMWIQEAILLQEEAEEEEEWEEEADD